ncbi:neur_chan_LBD domain-containing protein [Trichonephila clavipes]|nr:neur_chan_LBD domain-containing protein [Trichonephila clavipes]
MASEDEERLVRDLFRDYNKLIRPVEVMNKTVEVQFGLSFIQLINVVSDRGLPGHEFDPSTTKDPPCRAAMHVKSVES